MPAQPQWPLPTCAPRPGKIQVALLSWFDGIATARWALESLGIDVVFYLSYEIDKACKALIATQWPQALQRGDFRQDTAADIHALIVKAELPQGTILLITAGPPCPDFSWVRGRAAPGRSGEQGKMFDQFLDVALELQDLCGMPCSYLIENVLMQDPADIQHFNTRMATTAHLVDAIDLAPVRRPRLWWIPAPQLANLQEMPFLRTSLAAGADASRLKATICTAPKIRAGQAPTGEFTFHHKYPVQQNGIASGIPLLFGIRILFI